MNKKCRLRVDKEDYNILINHLFPGDEDEHGAVLLAGVSKVDDQVDLLVREVHLAKEGTDYVEGKIGYRALSPKFIHKLITRARDKNLVYLAVHNHPLSDLSVGFSSIDLESHERGYPALLQITGGVPVGALVLGNRSIEADIWLPEGERLSLLDATIISNTIKHLTPIQNFGTSNQNSSFYDRQIRMFGKMGQNKLARCRVGIIGLGGAGSLVAEYISRLGAGKYCLIDNDFIEDSNFSRIVGATIADVELKKSKVEIAARSIRQAKPDAEIESLTKDVAEIAAAKALTKCDYIFLAADSMRARLIVNAIVHQYLIPAVQIGAKVRSDIDGNLLDVMSANRQMRPGQGCLLCNQLIDPTKLALESKSDKERIAQAYGVEEPNPSVISLNAVATAHAVNDFLLDYLGLRSDPEDPYYEHIHFLKREFNVVLTRQDKWCSECFKKGKRYAMGDLVELPCNER